MGENDTIFRLEHVTKIFGEGSSSFKALDDINLEIERGDIYGIIGMSGAGKSTLVRTLNRLEDVSSGTVYFNGRDLSSFSEAELRKQRQSIGMIFQGYNLLMQRTVLKNVMMPMRLAKVPKEQQIKKAHEMLGLVGLDDKADAYPSQLSGGQKQRVAIARALSTDPDVLLCDEATSALDPKITGEILELLQHINRTIGVTIVIITHEMSVVEKICNKVAIIDHGRLAESGSVGQIFAAPSSEVGRQLVYPAASQDNPFDVTDKKCLRLAFDGHKAGEPIIADVITATGEKINILAANTKSIGGQAYGQMIIELPGPDEADQKIISYFRDNGLTISEVDRKEAEDVQ